MKEYILAHLALLAIVRLRLVVMPSAVVLVLREGWRGGGSGKEDGD